MRFPSRIFSRRWETYKIPQNYISRDSLEARWMGKPGISEVSVRAEQGWGSLGGTPLAGGSARGHWGSLTAQVLIGGRMVALLGILIWLVAWDQAWAQQKTEPLSSVPAEIKTPAFPGVAEVVPRTEELARKAEEARAQVEQRVRVRDLDQTIKEAHSRLKELAKRLSQMGDPKQWDFQKLQDNRIVLDNERKALEGHLSNISGRLNELENLRRQWEEQSSFWSEWRTALRAAQQEVPADVFAKADKTIRAVMEDISKGASMLVALQERISKLMEENRNLASPIETTLSRMRQETFRRTEPAFLTRGFLEHLRHSPWPAIGVGFRAAGRQAQESFRREEATVLFQAFLCMGLALLATWRGVRLRRAGQPEGFWGHPLALAVFVTGVFSSLFLGETSGPWKVGSRCAFAFAVAFLFGSEWAKPGWRRSLVSLASAVTLLEVLKTLGLPIGWYRLLLGVMAGAGAGLLLWFSRVPREVPSRVSLVAGGILTLVFLAQVAGFANLADRLFHACTWSLFLILSGVLLAKMGRLGLGWLTRQLRLPMGGMMERLGPNLERRIFAIVAGLIWLMVLVRLLPIWGLYASGSQAWEELSRLEVGMGRFSLSLGLLLMAALVVYIAFTLSWLLNAFLETEVFPRADVDPGARHAIGKLIHYLLIVLGFLFAMSLLGIQLESFLVLGGALGVGIGFGLQHVANNFISGLILLFERPVKVGDTVVVDKEWGRVKRIGLRSTVIETFDRSELIVPNSHLVSNTVTNWTLSNPMARLRIPVGVAYGTDLQKALGLLERAASTNRRVLKDPAPMALFKGFGESALDLELHAWVGDIKERLLAQSEICREVEKLFRESGVEIPFPQRTLHLKSIPPGPEWGAKG